MPQQRGHEGRPVRLFGQQPRERLRQQASRMLRDQAVTRRINRQLQRPPARQVDNASLKFACTLGGVCTLVVFPQ